MPYSETHFKGLYDEAYERFGTQCLWNIRPPIDVDGLKTIAKALKQRGDMKAFAFGEKIEADVKNAERHLPAVNSRNFITLKNT